MGSPGQRTRFDAFLLDVANFELRRHDRAVKIERRAMDLLILLVERRGQLVSRAEIVERLWGTDVFIDVDNGVNTVVRKVRLALRDDADAPRYIETVAGRGYRFIAATEVVAASVPRPAAPPPPPPQTQAAETDAPALQAPDARAAPATALWRNVSVWMLPAVLALVGFAMWRPGSADVTPPPAMRMVPLTTLSGLERGATFSPDGRQVAFTWSGANQENWDVYVALVGSADVRRLTMGSERDSAPRWSPDGRSIAYSHVDVATGSETLRVMSALGGSDRRVGDFAVQTTSTWSPDGRYLVTGRAKVRDEVTPTGLYLLPLDGSEPRRITTPQGAGVDWMPDFSPDGRRLAYASCLDPVFRSDCHLMVVDLDAMFAPKGDAKPLTRVPFWSARGVTWTRDGASVVYGVEQAGTHSLWRVDAQGLRPPEPIETGSMSSFPRVAQSGDLAFTRIVWDTDIYGLTGDSGGLPVARSSMFDGTPRFSPDARQLAFCSNRGGGAMEVWLSKADGSEPLQLTHGPGRRQCAPSWSPDGQSIAFESLTADGRGSIWTIDPRSGTTRQLTAEPGDHNAPSWSHDGRWIIHSSDRGGTRDIWRMRVDGGGKERLTQGGSGLAAMETFDGRFLVYQPATSYTHGPANARLLAQPLVGGPPREIVSCVMGSSFTVGRRGVYHVPCRNGDSAELHVVDPATGARQLIGSLAGYQSNVAPGLAIAPDGRTILYDRLVNASEDVILIQNFR